MKKYYGLVDENIDKLMENIGEMDYEYILKTSNKADLISTLENINSDDYTDYTIEIFTGDEDGEFIEGSDFDTIENFLKFQDLR